LAVTALQLFFDVTLGRGELMARMSHVHQPRKLPTVLGREEAERFLETVVCSASAVTSEFNDDVGRRGAGRAG